MMKTEDPTPEEIERRAGEIATRLLNTPWKKRTQKRGEMEVTPDPSESDLARELGDKARDR